MKIQQRIETELHALEPTHLEIINESHMHSGPPNRETHFRVVIVAAAFTSMNRVARHRAVQGPLKPLFNEGLHALAIEALSPQEFAANGATAESPLCASKRS